MKQTYTFRSRYEETEFITWTSLYRGNLSSFTRIWQSRGNLKTPMIKHHTKNKGDLGVLKAKLDLLEQGYLILNPETEHAPFDIVVYKAGSFKRIQVKYRKLNSKGVLEIPFRNSYSYSKGVVTKHIDKNEIDVFAIYCPDTDKCYYFNPRKFGKSLTLRVNASRNNQKMLTHQADNFCKIP